MKSWLRVIAVTALVSGAVPAFAQDVTLPDFPDLGMSGANPTEHSGAGVFHGNYCGLGDRGPGLPPTDALDTACMHHDECTPEGGTPSCACNARFRQETHAVAVSRRQPEDLRQLASTVEATIPLIPCH